jgi:O-antigen/teichoic acid export membrane protein
MEPMPRPWARLYRRFATSEGHLAELLRGGLLSMTVRILSVISGFFINVLVTRSLGAPQAGIFFLGVTIITVAGTLSRCGFDEAVIKRVAPGIKAGNWDDVNRIYTFFLVFVLVAAGAVSATIYNLAPLLAEAVFSKPELADVLKILALGIVPFALTYLHSQFFQAKPDPARFQLYQSFAVNLCFIGLIAASYLFAADAGHWSTPDIATLYLAALVGGLLLAFYSWLSQPHSGLRFGFAGKRGMIAFAVPILGITLLNMVMTWMAQLLLGALSTSTDVALFAVAFKTAMLTMIVLAATNSVLGPKFAKLHQAGDIAGMKYVAIWSTRLMLCICLPLTLLMLTGAEWIMSFFGAEFVAAKHAFMILVLGQFINVATGSVNLLLALTGNARYSLLGTLISVLVLLGLSLVLIDRYGATGAAIAQAIALATQVLINSLFVKKQLGFAPMNIFTRV